MCYTCQKDAYLVQRQAKYQPSTRKWSQSWHQWVVSCEEDLRAAEDLVLLWGLCVLGLSFLESCAKGYGWPHCLAVLIRVAQPKPWLALARQKPWHNSGEIAEISSWIPWTYRCRGLRIAHLCWNDILKLMEWSNVPVHPTLRKACKQWGRTTAQETTSGLSPLTTGQPRQAASTMHHFSDSDMWSLKSSTGTSYHFSQSCFLMVLLCAGTHRRTKPAQHWKGTVNRLLLGWLLSSCFSYDITAFKLQKKSISELKTYRLFHKKSKGEMLAGHVAASGHSRIAEYT